MDDITRHQDKAGQRLMHWPAFIQFHGDDELHFIASQSVWEQDTQSSTVQFHPEDVLVDSSGQVYRLQRDASGQLQCEPGGHDLSLDEVLQLVRRHAAQDGACCVAKLSAGSIAEAIALLA